MGYCAIFGCKNNNKKTFAEQQIRFFKFPKNKKLRNEWINACKRADKFNLDNAIICDKHFKPNDYRLSDQLLNLPLLKWKLNSDAIPSLNLPISSVASSIKQSSTSSSRTNRQLVKSNKIIANELIQKSLEEDKVEILSKSNFSLKEDEVEMEIPISPNYSYECLQIERLTCCHNELIVKQLRRENMILKRSLSKYQKMNQKMNQKMKHLEVELKQFKTDGQIRKLKKGTKKGKTRTKKIFQMQLPFIPTEVEHIDIDTIHENIQ